MDESDFGDFRVGIIGGRGRMGRWLSTHLTEQGIRVETAPSRDGGAEAALAARVDVLVLSVPVHQVEPVMAWLGRHTRPDGLVMDLCSLKQQPMASMLRHARGEVLGCHPLFGPLAPSLEGEIVFLCGGREGPLAAKVRQYLDRRGAQVRQTSAEEHDRLMAVVQSLRHMLVCGFGAAVEGAGGDLASIEPLAGPWFGRLAEVLRRQTTQPAALFADLALHNPQANDVIRLLRRSVDALEDALAAGDKAAMLRAMAPAWRLVGREGGDT